MLPSGLYRGEIYPLNILKPPDAVANSANRMLSVEGLVYENPPESNQWLTQFILSVVLSIDRTGQGLVKSLVG